MTTLTLSGPGSVFNGALRDFKKWKGRLPKPDSAFFEVSSDVYEAYREVVVARMGGAEEYRRWRKKQPTDQRHLRYNNFSVIVMATLPPDSINFVVKDWREQYFA
jgi:hypothetical protein